MTGDVTHIRDLIGLGGLGGVVVGITDPFPLLAKVAQELVKLFLVIFEHDQLSVPTALEGFPGICRFILSSIRATFENLDCHLHRILLVLRVDFSHLLADELELGDESLRGFAMLRPCLQLVPLLGSIITQSSRLSCYTVLSMFVLATSSSTFSLLHLLEVLAPSSQRLRFTVLSTCHCYPDALISMLDNTGSANSHLPLISKLLLLFHRTT